MKKVKVKIDMEMFITNESDVIEEIHNVTLIDQSELNKLYQIGIKAAQKAFNKAIKDAQHPKPKKFKKPSAKLIDYVVDRLSEWKTNELIEQIVTEASNEWFASWSETFENLGTTDR